MEIQVLNMDFLVFNTLKDARNYKENVSHIVGKLAYNYLGFPKYRVSNVIRPLGKRPRVLVNDKFRHARENKSPWYWGSKIYFPCKKFLNKRVQYWLIEDYRSFVAQLIKNSNKKPPNRTLKAYFKRFNRIPRVSLTKPQIVSNNVYDIEDLKELRRWIRVNTSYVCNLLDLCRVVDYSPYYNLERLMDFVDDNPRYFNTIIEVIEG